MTIDRALTFAILMSAVARGLHGPAHGAGLHPRGRGRDLR